MQSLMLPNIFPFSKEDTNMADGETRRRVIETDDEDAKLVFETSEEVKVTRSFDQMKLREDLVRGIYAYGKILYFLMLQCR